MPYCAFVGPWFVAAGTPIRPNGLEQRSFFAHITAKACRLIGSNASNVAQYSLFASLAPKTPKKTQQPQQPTLFPIILGGFLFFFLFFIMEYYCESLLGEHSNNHNTNNEEAVSPLRIGLLPISTKNLLELPQLTSPMKDPIDNLVKQPTKSALSPIRRQNSDVSPPSVACVMTYEERDVTNSFIQNFEYCTPDGKQKQNKRVKFSENNLETCFYFDDSPTSCPVFNNLNSDLVFEDPLREEILNLIGGS